MEEEEDEIPQEAKIAIAVVAFIILMENLLICFVIYRHHYLRTFTNFFVASLALSDILFATVMVPANFLAPNEDVLNGFLISIILLVNIGNICAVTLDRYVAVLKPLVYTYIMERNFRKILALSWTIPIIFSMIPLCWRSDLTGKSQSIYLLCMLVIMIITPYLFILLVYIRIFREVSKLEKNLTMLNRSYTLDSTSARKEEKRLSGEARVARLFAIIAAIFILSWLPIIHMSTALALKRLDVIPKVLPVISWFTLTLGNLMNAPLYALFKGDFRKALMKSFGLKKTNSNQYLPSSHQEIALSSQKTHVNE